jgi:hypothetical protein
LGGLSCAYAPPAGQWSHFYLPFTVSCDYLPPPDRTRVGGTCHRDGTRRITISTAHSRTHSHAEVCNLRVRVSCQVDKRESGAHVSGRRPRLRRRGAGSAVVNAGAADFGSTVGADVCSAVGADVGSAVGAESAAPSAPTSAAPSAPSSAPTSARETAARTAHEPARALAVPSGQELARESAATSEQESARESAATSVSGLSNTG